MRILGSGLLVGLPMGKTLPAGIPVPAREVVEGTPCDQCHYAADRAYNTGLKQPVQLSRCHPPAYHDCFIFCDEHHRDAYIECTYDNLCP